MQNRLKSKVVWVSIASLVLMILKNYNLLEEINLTADSYNEIIDSIISVLVLFGILNNPTKNNSF